MAEVCPTVLADTKEHYDESIKKIANFAHRIQIDLTDGVFAPSKTIAPKEAWWPVGVKADFHLMYKQPQNVLEDVLKHKPHLVIFHAESEGNFEAISHACRARGVKVGLALLPHTSVDSIAGALPHLDHLLIFSGTLGSYGGHANLDLVHKARQAKNLNPKVEVGWDGGVNQQNISQLAFGGVDVFNVGGAIQNAEDPERAYHALARIAQETGET